MKQTKLQRYGVTDCLKIFHLHFRLIFKFTERALFWLKPKNISKIHPPNAAEIFLISISDVKQTCKIVPT